MAKPARSDPIEGRAEQCKGGNQNRSIEESLEVRLREELQRVNSRRPIMTSPEQEW